MSNLTFGADMTVDDELSEDLMTGAAKIAKFLYGDASTKNRRKVYHLAAAKALPIFKIGAELHARKSTLRRAIEQREHAAASDLSAA
jgi:hypothetical protein